MTPEISIQPTPDDLVQAAARECVAVAQSNIADRNRCTIALAGGSTPRALYQLLAADGWRERIDWAKTHIFFGDERAVPPNDERSNYRMARLALLDHIPIPADHIHRMRADETDLEAAADDYNQQLRDLQAPLDLILLGMGNDGHTASLFPHTPVLQEQTRWCVATDIASHEPHVRRLTLTYPALNAARNIFILATGDGKAERLQAVLHGPRDPLSMPIQGLQPQGRLVWMLDAAAARLIAS